MTMSTFSSLTSQSQERGRVWLELALEVDADVLDVDEELHSNSSPSAVECESTAGASDALVAAVLALSSVGPLGGAATVSADAGG